MRKLALLAAGIVVAAIAAGCGNGGTNPRGVAQQYLNDMKNGDFQSAALLWDYTTYARQQNPDWDSIAPGQRKLIIDTLAKSRAKTLSMWATHFTPSTKIAEFGIKGDTAHAALEGGDVGGIDLKKIGDVWRVSAMR